jgi:hypothetical protein
MEEPNAAISAATAHIDEQQADSPPMLKRNAHRSKLNALPSGLRAEFDRRLIEGGFSDYRGLSAWLRKHGYQISCVTLALYGRALDRKLEVLRLATEQARAVVKAAEGADDLVNEGLMRLVQGDLFRVLVEVKEIDPNKVDINALARNVASICRSSVSMRKAAEQMHRGIGQRVLAAERKVIAALRGGGRGGLSAAAERQIRAALLEITDLPAPADEAAGISPAPKPNQGRKAGAPALASPPPSAQAEEIPGEATS